MSAMLADPALHETLPSVDHRDSVLTRISTIIDAFDPASPVLSLGRLTERTGLPKSTVYRLTEQLVELRWLERSVSGYRLGLKFFEIGGLVAVRNRLRTYAMPHLQDLRTKLGQSVHMGVLDEFDVVILAKVWGHEGSLPTWDGGRMPAYCTATGKVLLAYQSEEVVEEVIARGFRRRTPATVMNAALFRKGLELVRERGFATEYEENVKGLCCVAAPILDRGRAVAAISASGPVLRFDPAKSSTAVMHSADQIASLIGH